MRFHTCRTLCNASGDKRTSMSGIFSDINNQIHPQGRRDSNSRVDGDTVCFGNAFVGHFVENHVVKMKS